MLALAASSTISLSHALILPSPTDFLQATALAPPTNSSTDLDPRSSSNQPWVVSVYYDNCVHRTIKVRGTGVSIQPGQCYVPGGSAAWLYGKGAKMSVWSGPNCDGQKTETGPICADVEFGSFRVDVGDY